jgi:O-antigen/teichoic acid export membrane protein
VVERDEIEAGDVALTDLKRKTTRGALISTIAQLGTFVLRTASLMVLARLLIKEDFGLVNMATAFIGILALLRDSLSSATIQRDSITGAQASTFFWINLAVGALLAATSALAAPLLVVFFDEPRLFWITVLIGTSLLFNGAAAQHRALIQRGLRFGALAAVDLAGLLAGVVVGIGMAVAEFGYWSLVATAVVQAATSAGCAWIATRWIPGKPQSQAGIGSMLAFGGAVTASSVLTYIAFNIDKVLVGRFWGPTELGVYGRAYQLVNLPNETLYSTIGMVAFPALSRVQNDPQRLKNFFLKGYCLVLSLAIPVTAGCALFAEDIILVFLGPRWSEAVPVFRFLTPAILVFAFTNPFSWLMLAGGHAGRGARIAMAVTPLLILGYLLGIGSGPVGVAMGFSVTMAICLVPVLLWAKQGMLITMTDILRAARPALVSVVLGAAATLAAQPVINYVKPGFPRLVVECSVFFGVYLLGLLFVMKQMPVYIELLREMRVLPSGPWRSGGRKA